LDKLLFNSDEEISDTEKISLSYQIAQGLLHIHRAEIVHRDLASRNILLTGDRTPKLSDFGMSRMINKQEGKTMATEGPIKWMAPEAFNQIYSKKSDVWSYGIVLSEIVNRREPYEGLNNLDAGTQIRDKFLTPAINEDKCPPILLKIMKMCWNSSPKKRPSADVICTEFETVIKD